MSLFDDDLGQELQREEAVKPKSSLKPRRGSRRQSRRVSQAGVDAAVAAAVGEKSEATGDNIGKALSKITGQAKALKFAMDLAQKAYDARDEEEDDDFHVDCEESDEDDQDEQRQDSEVEKLRQRAKSEPAAKEELEMAELFTNLESPTFQPAPLHVRGLCQGAKRACERSLAVEEQRLAVAEMLGQTQGGESPKNVECLTDEEQQNLDVTRKRLRYNVDLLRRRRQRLANIDNKTFQQLPEQLIEAGADGDYEFIRLCVEAGVPLDIFNERGVTPLILATVNNKVASARLLLESGADPSMQDINGATCAHYAIELRRFQILDAALEAMTRRRSWLGIYIKDARGYSVLDYARLPDHDESLRLLKLRLGGPLGFVWAVTESMVYNAMIKMPKGEQNKRGLAKHVAKLAAERAAAKVKEKIQQTKDKAREKLLGGALCSYCSEAKISEKKLSETIHMDMPDSDEDDEDGMPDLQKFTDRKSVV